MTKKIQRHDSEWSSRPPITGPSAGAMTVGTMITRLAAARSDGGKARNSIAVPTGMSIPPPAPCSRRKATSCPSEPARPHRTDATVNSATATRNVRLVPTRSPIQPEAGMKTARLSR